jgi:voltage-gated sodium channel
MLFPGNIAPFSTVACKMKIQYLIESHWFQNFIIAVICINGAVLGIETSKTLSPESIEVLIKIDQLCLLIFVVELLLKFYVYRLNFFKEGWNIFDFVIVGIALVPATGQLSILRAFRIFRVLRLITTVDSIRRVVTGMLIALPGVGSVGGLLLIFFYIGAVISTTLYGEVFPDWFGDIGLSMYTLFQIMTLESWSMGIVRPVMEQFPYAWIFFIPFITVTTFMVLNLFIGIVVDALATVKEQDEQTKVHKLPSTEDTGRILEEIAALRLQVEALRSDSGYRQGKSD